MAQSMRLLQTMHHMHTKKKTMNSASAPNGFSGLETSLAAVITNAYGPDKLSIDQVVYYMSTRPAGVDAPLMQVFLKLVSQRILLYSLQLKSGQ